MLTSATGNPHGEPPGLVKLPEALSSRIPSRPPSATPTASRRGLRSSPSWSTWATSCRSPTSRRTIRRHRTRPTKSFRPVTRPKASRRPWATPTAVRRPWATPTEHLPRSGNPHAEEPADATAAPIETELAAPVPVPDTTVFTPGPPEPATSTIFEEPTTILAPGASASTPAATRPTAGGIPPGQLSEDARHQAARGRAAAGGPRAAAQRLARVRALRPGARPTRSSLPRA